MNWKRESLCLVCSVAGVLFAWSILSVFAPGGGVTEYWRNIAGGGIMRDLTIVSIPAVYLGRICYHMRLWVKKCISKLFLGIEEKYRRK